MFYSLLVLCQTVHVFTKDVLANTWTAAGPCGPDWESVIQSLETTITGSPVSVFPCLADVNDRCRVPLKRNNVALSELV